MISRSAVDNPFPPNGREAVDDVLISALKKTSYPVIALKAEFAYDHALTDFKYEYVNVLAQNILHKSDLIGTSLLRDENNLDLFGICLKAIQTKKHLSIEKVIEKGNILDVYILDVFALGETVIISFQEKQGLEDIKYSTRASNTVLSAVMERMHAFVIVIDDSNKILALNSSSEELHPIFNKENIGKDLFEIFPAGNWSDIKSGCRIAIKTSHEVRIERFFPHLKRWFNVGIYPYQESVAIFFEDITPRKKQEQDLLRLTSVIASSHDAIVVTDLKGKILEWNFGAEEIYHYTKAEMVGKYISEVFPRGKKYELVGIMNKIKNGEAINSLETTRIQRNGEKIHVSVSVSPVFGEYGRVIGASAIIRPLTDLKRAISLLSQSEQRFKNAISIAPIPIIIFDNRNKVLNVSNGFIEHSGYKRGEIISFKQVISELFPDPKYRSSVKKKVDKMLEKGNNAEPIEVNIKNKHGEIRLWDLNVSIIDKFPGGRKLMMAIAKDMTHHRQTETHFVDLAYKDSLTGLMNRVYFNEQLTRTIKKAKRTKTEFSIAFLDIDNFKTINDTLGHRVGDLLLEEVGRRLKTCITSSDVIARQGGDEFTFILPDNKDINDTVFQCLLDQLRMPFVWKNRIVHFTGSVGVSRYPEDAKDEEHLLMHADRAMYAAKHQGGNQVVFFKKGFRDVRKDGVIVRDFESECFMRYQGMYDLSNKPVALESLLAHIHDEVISGGETLIENARSYNNLRNMTEWSIREICREVSLIPSPIKVSINISHSQIDKNLSKHLDKYTKMFKVERNRIICEIPALEELFRDNDALSCLRELANKGYLLALDRFGEKSTSVLMLTRLPLYEVKIARALLLNLQISPEVQNIVKGFIKIAHAIDVNVVGVGIESKEAETIMKSLGFDYLQGYFLHKPSLIQEIVNGGQLLIS